MTASVTYESHDTDILILGSGGAGLFAALHAHRDDAKLKITLAAKGLIGKCGCTRMVQGGYNAALAPGDSVARHFMDTIEGGKWLPHQDMAWKLCETAIIRVRQLENEFGCFFDRNADGSIRQKAFAGQSFDRTVHKGDLTGIEIMNRLMEQVMALPLRCLEEHRAVALIPSAHHNGRGDGRGDGLCGALLIDMRTGEFRLVRAAAVLLATGGGPSMYRYHTPSGDKSMDGLAMALRLGLPLRDMEMVQFHPTGLLAGSDTRITGTVLEEGLRGAGGHLLNSDGHRFLFDYDDGGERATRDIVSRAIYAEMRAGRTTPNGGVYLSMGHLGAERVREKFPGMVKRCADCGFDLAAGRVEVVPTAHYFMGGVVCDADTFTEMPGLFVAGEDAGGTHGANRLGGNGVANSTVYGGVAGEQMAQYVATHGGLSDPDTGVIETEIENARRPFRRPANLSAGHSAGQSTSQAAGNLNDLRRELMDITWREVGVLRTGPGLRRGLDRIGALKAALSGINLAGGNLAFNLSWHDWLNLRNLIDVSEVIARAALSRENSRGAHFREDFPASGALHDSYFTVARQSTNRRTDASVEVTRRPVAFTIVKPGESLLAESGRENPNPTATT